MRLIRAADCKVMPWKNGGGATTEIAIHPAGASLDDFEWRISMAQVGCDGPFSTFAGIDRTLSVLSGAGITLAFADGDSVALTQTSLPYAFDGERPVGGRLIDGAITDLNVMTRRGRWRHEVGRLAGSGPVELSASGGLLVFVAPAGGWTIGDEKFGAGDSVVLQRGEQRVLIGDGGAIGFAITFRAGIAT